MPGFFFLSKLSVCGVCMTMLASCKIVGHMYLNIIVIDIEGLDFIIPFLATTMQIKGETINENNISYNMRLSVYSVRP